MDERGGRKERPEVWGDLGFGGPGGVGLRDKPKRSASFFSLPAGRQGFFGYFFLKKVTKRKKR